jgi:beta-lactamase superfamily II metal-dependent hydrolase
MKNIIFHNFKTILIVCALLFIFNVYGALSFFGGDYGLFSIYFLNVGQGDSELIVFPTGARVLIDGGPANGAVAREIGSIFHPWDRAIDIAIVTHPEEDHFGGLVDLYDRVPVGAVLSSGIEKESGGFEYFKEKTREMNIREIKIAKGDILWHGSARMDVLWPEKDAQSMPTNDAGIVIRFEAADVKILFTGDIGGAVEKKIAREVGDVHILKVGHHGSKYSSTDNFLRVIRPEIAVIESGRNSYGHPSEEALRRIIDYGSRIFRTDTDGTIRIDIFDGKASIYALH